MTEQLALFDDVPYRVGVPPRPWDGLPPGWDPALAADNHAAAMEAHADPARASGLSQTQYLILAYGTMLTDLVYRKNLRYGNSAVEPMAVFAQELTPQQRMAVRMDDKVNRIVRGQGSFADDGENPYVDLAGYLLLALVADALGKG